MARMREMMEAGDGKETGHKVGNEDRECECQGRGRTQKEQRQKSARVLHGTLRHNSSTSAPAATHLLVEVRPVEVVLHRQDVRQRLAELVQLRRAAVAAAGSCSSTRCR